VGLVSGNRNVTLVWAAASFGLPPLAEGYVAASVVPVLALPLVAKLAGAFIRVASDLSIRTQRHATAERPQ
jgi:hypothetical protein